MKVAIRHSRTVVIRRPPEIDVTNAEQVAAQIRTAYKPDTVIVADMTKTTF